MTATTHALTPTSDLAATGQPVRTVPADVVRRALARRSYAVLATVSPAGRPHAAGVLYTMVGDASGSRPRPPGARAATCWRARTWR